MEERLKKIEKRLFEIEEKFQIATGQFRKPEAAAPAAGRSDSLFQPAGQKAGSAVVFSDPVESASTLNLGMFLGGLAALCLVLAGVFLIKLGVDSGWLDAERQIGLAVLTASGLIAVGVLFRDRDSKYFAILPGVGIALMHMAAYGALHIHGVISEWECLLYTQGIGLLSVGLYFFLKEANYVNYAMIGTHLGFILLHQSFFTNRIDTFLFVAWSVFFSFLCVQIRSRSSLTYLSYFGFFTILVSGMHPGTRESTEWMIWIPIVEFLLFFIYLVAFVSFSRRENQPLSNSELVSVVPALGFFYATEHYWLSLMMGQATVWVFIATAILMFIAYSRTQRVMGVPLSSGRLVYIYIGLVLTHAVYIETVPDQAKPLFALLTLAAFTQFAHKLELKGKHIGLSTAAIVIGMTGYLFTLFGAHEWSPIATLCFGFAFGIASFMGYFQRRDFALLLPLGHLQILVALYRVRQQMGLQPAGIYVSVLWLVYLIGFFAVAWSRKSKEVCQSSLFILLICAGKLFLYDLWDEKALIRILSFLVFGGVLFVFGYLFRKMEKWTT